MHESNAGMHDEGVKAGLHGRKRRLACALVHSCIGAFLLLGPSEARAEVLDRVLAVVNGDLITLSDVTAARDLGLVAEGNAGNAGDQVQVVLSALIDRALELDEVDRYAPPEPATEAVDRELAAVRARFPSQAAFDGALARSGIDLQHLRGTLRENLRIKAYLDQRFVAAEDRRPQLIDDWLASLRRRAELNDLYSTIR